MSRMSKVCRAAAALILIVLMLNLLPAVMFNGTNQDRFSRDTRISLLHRVIANDPHGPIAINGDANFSVTASAETWTGDGSAQNPYVIENYDFDLGPTPTSSINISHTSSHFIIRNCNFQGPAATPSYGIYFDNVTNAQIIDNDLTEFSHGINIPTSSSNIYVSGNDVSYNSYAIYLRNSVDSTVIDNTCNGNFFYGIFMHTCESSSVIDNTCNEDPMAGIYIYNCSSNIVSGNTCKDSDFGIYLQEQGSHTITDNFCENNTNSGIVLNNCDLNTVANNTSIDNGIYGVTLFLNSDNNDILWNALVNNTGGDGYDQDTGNVFSYNYYSDYVGVDNNLDYIGDTSHIFQFNSDSTPLMYIPFAPDWAVPPEDQVIELGTEWEYDLQFFILEPSAPYVLFVNDSLNFADLDYDTIISRDILPVGNYPIEVNATNVYGYFTKGIFELSIRDTTPPFITHEDDITFTVRDYDPELLWVMSDLSPLTFILLKNGTEVTSLDIPTTHVTFSIFIENYEPGVYNYTMVAVDIWDNVAMDMVIVTILPVPFLEVMLPWLMVGSVAIVIVIVIVVILRKRRST